MEWVLLIVLAGGDGKIIDFSDRDFVEIQFATENECMDAAEAFVEDNPVFEFVNRPGLPEGGELLVIRPTVGCFPARSE